MVVIDSGVGGVLMVNVRVFCTACGGDKESCSVNVCEVVPAAAGVPVIAPVCALSERLAGRAGVTDHVYGGKPPEPLTAAP